MTTEPQAPKPAKPYVEVRALRRGLELLLALNRIGSARASLLAKMTGIDRTTTYRMLATLEAMGLVEQRQSNDEYGLAAHVRDLSDGYSERDHLTRIAANRLGMLFPKVLWPTDFATFEKNVMVIRETTHKFSPYSVHRKMIGRVRPLFASALGRAFLAGASAEQREQVVEIALRSAASDGGLPPAGTINGTMDKLLRDFARDGYASSVGETEAQFSAIALPVIAAAQVVGSVNVVFFRSAMTPAEAAERFLAPLRECVEGLGSDLGQSPALPRPEVDEGSVPATP